MNNTKTLLEQFKELKPNELPQLVAEIRETIITTVSRNGGHLSSNLGVVELSIALHRVFDSPHDKIIWDVGHQCYAHKLLTGRFEVFAGLRLQGGIAGFPKHSESPHDAFNTGHASTSISAALGILAAFSIQGIKQRVVAVIGDGALTGGLAYEALSHAGQLGLPLIVILNDNKMSISPNVGGLSKYLSRLSMKSRYQVFRRRFDGLIKRIPFVGPLFLNFVLRLKRAVKAVFYTDNFFVDLGFEYVGPIEGHRIGSIEQVLLDVRKLDHPVVVHVITRKGKGYRYAENDPSTYHGVGSFSIKEGLNAVKVAATFTEAFGAALVQAARTDERIVAVTAAMEKGTGLTPFHTEFPKRFFDVGIAESHAVTFAAGLAAAGLRPVVVVYSTFIQRAIDQVIHDVSLQQLPVVFALDRAGLVPDDGETHQGIYDISLFRSVPDMRILTPATENEISLMLDWALTASGPCAIRYPKSLCPPLGPSEREGFSQTLVEGRGVFIRLEQKSSPESICIAFTGSLYPQVREAAEILRLGGLSVSLYHLRFLKPIDELHLTECLSGYAVVVFAEEGVAEGGFNEYAAALALRLHWKTKVLCLGLSAARWQAAPSGCAAVPGVFTFTDCQGKRDELLRIQGLDAQSMAAAIQAFIALELRT
ncbi:1-deoxy-D-xylulose-5-phosphate synthase [Spirochaetia bacterium]|nr:1-deoxy-D-xylulose-5-phosphate synthase [Spirochaetia bacterium]